MTESCCDNGRSRDKGIIPVKNSMINPERQIEHVHNHL